MLHEGSSAPAGTLPLPSGDSVPHRSTAERKQRHRPSQLASRTGSGGDAEPDRHALLARTLFWQVPRAVCSPFRWTVDVMRITRVLTAATIGLLGSGCSADRIAGSSPGSVPGQQLSPVRLICPSSIPNGAPALVVVDGEVWGTVIELGDSILARLHPRQIDTIQVLRDAAAVDRFGERGRHGVIVIRTRDSDEAPPVPPG
jgi:hypothetical protein